MPREILDARKPLWSKLKAIKEQELNSKVNIICPAKLVKDGHIIADSFPDWNIIMNRSRLCPEQRPVNSLFSPAPVLMQQTLDIPSVTEMEVVCSEEEPVISEQQPTTGENTYELPSATDTISGVVSEEPGSQVESTASGTEYSKTQSEVVTQNKVTVQPVSAVGSEKTAANPNNDT